MTTLLLPALDILDGHAVRLTGGAFDKVTDYGENLADILSAYATKGCRMAHLVDLSGARNPDDRQLDLLREICANKPLKIQIGGGIRTNEDVKALFDIGADRIVIGSWAVKNPEAILGLIDTYGGDRFVLAMDCNVDENGEPKVAVDGWQHSSGQSLHDVLQAYQGCENLTILCTDISRDGMLNGPNVPLYKALMHWWPQFSWIASGGVSKLDDLAAIADARIPAVVVGKAIYENRFTVKEALATLEAHA